MNKIFNWFGEHSPELLLGAGIVSFTSAVILAVKATPKASQILEENNVDTSKPVEVVKATWTNYIPAAVAFAVGIGCVVGSHRIDVSRNAILMAAYATSDTAFREYREHTGKIFGDDADSKVSRSISTSKEKEGETPVREVIIRSSSDIFPVKDSVTGRVIYTSKEALNDAQYELNELIRAEDFAQLNDWYYLLGLDLVYPIGDNYGWNVNDGQVKLDLSCNDRTENDIPCALLKYTPSPRLGYQFKTEKLVIAD